MGWILAARSASVHVVAAWSDYSAGEVTSFREAEAAPAVSTTVAAVSYASAACGELWLAHVLINGFSSEASATSTNAVAAYGGT